TLFRSIDGYTQLGSSENTLPVGNNAQLGIEIKGPGGTDGLVIMSDGNTIQGLVINNFNDFGGIIILSASGNVIRGNFIGTDPSGMAAVPNARGVFLANGCTDNTVGGAAPGDRNLISGNNNHGILIDGMQTKSNRVLGNYVGTDATGTSP